jgi:hypothetical protein
VHLPVRVLPQADPGDRPAKAVQARSSSRAPENGELMNHAYLSVGGYKTLPCT